MKKVNSKKKKMDKQVQRLKTIRKFDDYVATMIAEDDKHYKYEYDKDFHFETKKQLKEAKSEDEPASPLLGADISYEDTKLEQSEIGPAPMAHMAKYTLKQACDAQGHTLGLEDFEGEEVIGKGGFGKVLSVTCKLNGSRYALKVLDKEAIIKKDFERSIYREKDITSKMNHPNIIRLEAYFMDTQNCYFLLPL